MLHSTIVMRHATAMVRAKPANPTQTLARHLL
jgi:hypothetical protein